MQGEQIRACLRAGQRVYGTHVTQTSNSVAISLLAARAGIDFVFLCSEHMPLDRTEMSALCHLFSSQGVSPIVRLSHPSAEEAAQALDGGAQGIVAPYVETVEEVQALVGAVHLRPAKGRQLHEYLTGSREMTEKMQAFFNRFNRQNYAIIGVESVAAYENLDQLRAVPGVDGVFLGPHDLTVSLGKPEEWDDPDFQHLMLDTVKRCRAAGVGVGVHIPGSIFTLERVQELIYAGMNWILDGADVTHAIENLRARRTALRIPLDSDDAAPTSVRVSSCAAVERQTTK